MNDPVILAVAAALALLVVVVLVVALSRRRHRRLAEHFGPEYEHAVATHGRRKGERELESRREHLESLPLRDLTAEERSELVRRWDRVQARFVDQPVAAIADADALIAETMNRRGYPVDEVADEERREADLSAAHPGEVGIYRQAAAIARRSRSNEATTEELRQAMVHYRTLFESLSGRTRPPAADGAAPVAERRPERPGEAVQPADHGRLDDPLGEPAAEPRAARPGEPVAAGETAPAPTRRA